MNGTKPDGYSSRAMTDDPDENRRLFREMRDGWPEMKWARFTVDEDHRFLWLEVWRRRPEQEAPFDFPYVATSTASLEQKP